MARTRQRPVPVDRERPFSLPELFFSTTDFKAIIRSGNDVFLRVANYSREELVGRNHNVVRHPDMPRSVFEVFWRYLKAKKPIAAFVKNLASDGHYYWVLATTVPLPDGYLSVRMKPTTEYFEAAKKIYKKVKAVEDQIEGGNVRRRKEAIEAGVQEIVRLLNEAGFPDYDTFMHQALVAEVTTRQAAMDRWDRLTPSTDPAVSMALRACQNAEHQLDNLVRNLEGFSRLSDELHEKSRFVLGLAEEIRLFALNVVLASSRLGGDGAALGAVAEILGRRSDEAEPAIRALNEALDEAVSLIGVMGFRIALSKLQTEMVSIFLGELRNSGRINSERAKDLQDLTIALSDGADELRESMRRFEECLIHVDLKARDVDSQLRVVRALEVNGRVEGARLEDNQIADLFLTIAKQVGQARDELQTFRTLRERSSRGGSSDGDKVRRAMMRACDEVRGLLSDGKHVTGGDSLEQLETEAQAAALEAAGLDAGRADEASAGAEPVGGAGDRAGEPVARAEGAVAAVHPLPTGAEVGADAAPDGADAPGASEALPGEKAGPSAMAA